MVLKKIRFILPLTILLLSATCGVLHTPTKKLIRTKGSDTMYLLMKRLAEEYMRRNPGISVYTEGGGSASGIQALIRGEIDICAASRPLQAKEIKQLSENYRSVGVVFRIAKDALSVYLNKKNPVRDLTMKQLKQIFSGEITNWKAVGGTDHPITVLIRPPNSGTYLYFKRHVLEGREYTNRAITIPTTAKIVETVAADQFAIGYGGIAYGKTVKLCRVNSIPPTSENIRYDLYPISRYLYLITVRKPQGIRRKFIDWIISNQGQAIIKQVGYIPLWQ